VTFFISSSPSSQMVTLDAQGQATMSWANVGAGTWTITAQYSGDNLTGPASANATVTVVGPQTVVTIGSSQNPAPVASTVLLTISVDAANGGAPATGSVDVFDSLTGITSTLTVTNGQAVYTMIDPAAGDHLLEVSFYDPSHTWQPSGANFTQS